jgi:hypothetical protein
MLDQAMYFPAFWVARMNFLLITLWVNGRESPGVNVIFSGISV